MNKNKKISNSLKRFHKRKKSNQDAKAVAGVIMLAIYLSIVINLFTPTALADYEEHYNPFPIAKDKEMTVQEKVVYYAQKSGVDIKTALRIANCESTFRANAKSKISSASGVFQFIDKTWANYCYGDRMNADDNIKCFMKLYPQHPSWWECK